MILDCLIEEASKDASFLKLVLLEMLRKRLKEISEASGISELDALAIMFMHVRRNHSRKTDAGN